MTSRKPLRTRHTVVFWVAIVFILLVTSTVGISLITEGMSGRRALAQGPVGTLTPTGRECGKTSCSLRGTFASADGAVTEADVELKDAVRIRRGDPLPASAIDDVRLDREATRATAYTDDYSWRGPVFKGGLLFVAGLGLAGVLVMVWRRHRSAGVPS